MTDDLIPKPEQCGASARIQIGPMPYIGPCVLRHDHDGPVHQDAAGAQWTDPRPATAEDSAGLCPASLRDQIAEALPCPVCPAQAGEPCVRAREDNQQPHVSRRLRADAVMPVVEAALAALRASLDRAHTMAADRPDWRPAYDRLARALTDALTRAETAERERDQALDLLRELTDTRPCNPHPGNGYCQTHGEKPPCPHAAATALLVLAVLAALDAEQKPSHTEEHGDYDPAVGRTNPLTVPPAEYLDAERPKETL